MGARRLQQEVDLLEQRTVSHAVFMKPAKSAPFGIRDVPPFAPSNANFSSDASVRRLPASSVTSCLGSEALPPVRVESCLPADLVTNRSPPFDVVGTRSEPVIYLKNVDGCQGRLFAGRVLGALAAAGMKTPSPKRGQRSSITVEWHRNKRSPTPWRTGLRVLGDLAEQLLRYLSRDEGLLRDAPALRQLHRGWSDTEVLLSTPGCKLKRHRDIQPDGALLFIFCAGLSCRSLAWPGGHLTERLLESGDVMILDGRRTEHAIAAVLEDTSPFSRCPWLGQRRLSALVRQPPLVPQAGARLKLI